MGVKTKGVVGFTSSGVIVDAVSVAVQQTLVEATEVMLDVIETGGTGYEGKRGRIATGAMRSSVNSEMTEVSEQTVSGRVGYINNAPAHTGYQEFGVDNHYYWGVLQPGKTIPGLFALRDAEEDAAYGLVDKLDLIFEDVLNGKL